MVNLCLVKFCHLLTFTTDTCSWLRRSQLILIKIKFILKPRFHDKSISLLVYDNCTLKVASSVTVGNDTHDGGQIAFGTLTRWKYPESSIHNNNFCVQLSLWKLGLTFGHILFIYETNLLQMNFKVTLTESFTLHKVI